MGNGWNGLAGPWGLGVYLIGGGGIYFLSPQTYFLTVYNKHYIHKHSPVKHLSDTYPSKHRILLSLYTTTTVRVIYVLWLEPVNSANQNAQLVSFPSKNNNVKRGKVQSGRIGLPTVIQRLIHIDNRHTSAYNKRVAQLLS